MCALWGALCGSVVRVINTPRLQGPLSLTVFILLSAAAGFGCGVRGLPWWYQLLLGVFIAGTLLALWLTNQLNPGIVAGKGSERDAVVELLEDGHSGFPGYSKYSQDHKQRWIRRIVTEDGYEDHEKYCVECNVWRPRRGYHCEACGHCMDRGDHHCPMMGNCVARLNHRFFAAHLNLGLLACAALLGGCVWRLKILDFPAYAARHNGESYVLIIIAAIYGYLAVCLCLGLFHTCGLVLDYTTKDMGTRDESIGGGGGGWKGGGGDGNDGGGGAPGSDPPLFQGDRDASASVVARRSPECGDLPCLPGKRNPCALARAWRSTLCGPMLCLPESASADWRGLPSAQSAASHMGATRVSTVDEDVEMASCQPARPSPAALVVAVKPAGQKA